MNYETIQSFLNSPVSKLLRDEEAIAQAKDTLKRYESFNNLLENRLELFEECEKICSLELFENLALYPNANRDFILGFKFGIAQLKNYYEKYMEAKDYISKGEF